MVENQPVSFDGLPDAKPVRLHGLDQPKTTLAMMVEKLTCLLTNIPKLLDKGMGQSDMHEMLYSKGVNWADLELRWKNGVFIQREINGNRWLTMPAPIFTQSRDAIEVYLTPTNKGETG